MKLATMAESTGMAAQWASACLQAIESADQKVIEAWWSITSESVASSLDNVLKQERTSNRDPSEEL